MGLMKGPVQWVWTTSYSIVVLCMVASLLSSHACVPLSRWGLSTKLLVWPQVLEVVAGQRGSEDVQGLAEQVYCNTFRVFFPGELQQ